MLDEENKKRLKAIFNSWEALLSERKELNAQINDLIAEASEISGRKKKQVRQSFTFLKNRIESGEDELDGITTLTIEMEEG